MWIKQRGGLYFIEDMQVSRDSRYENSHGKFIMADVIKDWIEQLIIPPKKNNNMKRNLRQEEVRPPQSMWKNEIPPDINW